jgi:hypothetical protein
VLSAVVVVVVTVAGTSAELGPLAISHCPHRTSVSGGAMCDLAGFAGFTRRSDW